MMRRGKQVLSTAITTLLVVSTGWIPSSPEARSLAGDPMVQDEIILARQGLMEAVYELLNEGERPENDAELAAMHVNAEAVALSLPPLKHLFPAATNPRSPNYRSSYTTYALPIIWEEFERFSQYLTAATDAAHAFANARDPAQFPELAGRLLAACETCHAAFRAEFQSPLDALTIPEARPGDPKGVNGR
jgi:cytochrome c556